MQRIEEWNDRTLSTVISPSTEYEPLVKMISKASGLEWVLVNHKAIVTAIYKEYNEELKRMEAYKEGNKPWIGIESEHSSVNVLLMI